ncbi:hybrid sensor histidine kinase/response regulator transcription factor [Labilibaculum antarcticum]|uniref:histidine kinase n=1 Tax=Labilibaculum antarcticum TaxID=1717717 RepID=A0A1Y1CQ55_9BACT|nr:hybrid sensor histidine kinase/response regulator transcription factor [Labilibaculum antarcticum]BAX82072.1 hybrid sensor histidine kinase/response regulator [Labilibaculum antarcticum]
MKKLICLVFIFFQLGFLTAQEYIFEKITTQQGLSQNDVNCIFQDHNGFLWIGTNDGLNRYDGYSFRTFRINQGNKQGEGLSSNLIYKVKEDQKGKLWIGTSNEGVCVFDVDKETFTQIRNTAQNPIQLADSRVLDLECMADGTVWVATAKGVTIISEVNGQYETTNLITVANTPLVSKGCNVVSEDLQGRKWLGFYRGLVVCEKVSNRIKTTQIKEFEHLNVRSIIPVISGFLVATDSGLFFLQEDVDDSNQRRLVQINDFPTNDIYLDEYQNLYASSNKKLLVYSCDFINQKFKFKAEINQGRSKSDLNSSLIMSIYGDSSGIIWIGTNGGGLNKYNPKRKKISHYKSTGQQGSLSCNKIRSIFEDSSHNIWFATEGGGVDYLEASKNRNFASGFKNHFAIGDKIENRIYSVIETKNNKGENEIWAGAGFPQVLERFGNDGKHLASDEKDLISDIGASIFTMLKDKDENIWLGTYGSAGLFKYEIVGDTYRLTNYRALGEPGNISSNIVRSLMQDKQGNIWVGTDAGLNFLSVDELAKPSPSFKVFNNNPENENSLSNDYILPLFQATNGDLWVGTMGGGLNKINYKNNIDSISFTRYNTSDGFPNNVIKGILEDSNECLWISSNKGLTRFNPKTNDIMNYDINDGLQDNEFGELACCKLSDGMMIFGGVNGFNTFYPEQIIEDKTPPKVAFTDLQVLNESVKVGEKVHRRVILDKVINHTNSIKLKNSENSFAIYFSSLHFSAPQKNKYKYMLEGFDKSWIVKNSDERFAKYTSLAAGKYVFKLYASNNDGIWSEEAKQIEIVVIPPWWHSNLALLAYGLLFLVLLWFFQRFSIIKIKQKNELLMEHFEKEKIEELNQMKFRFFTNISHEFRTPLSLIIGSVQKLLRNEEELSEKARERCLAVERNSSIMLRLINQLLDFRKMEQDKMKLLVRNVNIVQVLKEIYFSFQEMASNKNIQFKFSGQEDELYVWVDTDKIEKIVYNLLSNAFKFTNVGGQIELVLSYDTDHIIIQVKDNGVGIPKQLQSHIFERFYQGTKLRHANSSGTGIGLSYSKGLAELHGGEISFESAEGVGSCFELVLKRGKGHYKSSDVSEDQSVKVESINRANSEVEIIQREIKQLQDDSESSSREHSLLIVEDNIELLEFLTDAFTDYYNVYQAVNGVEGLEMAEKYDIDIIVSDISMPIKDGLELCREVKTNERISHIPIILLTAKTSSEDSIKGFQLGADAYVSKPFDLNVLEAQIAGVLRNRNELKQRFNKTIEINPSEVTTTSADERFLKKLLTIIEENISNYEFTVEQLAKIYGMPQVNINKKLKSLTGQTANAFIRSVRLKRACQLLKTGRYSVADVTYEVGFSDLKYFRSCFKKEFDLNPSEYAKQENKE